METITLLQGEQPSWISDYGGGYGGGYGYGYGDGYGSGDGYGGYGYGYGDGSGKMCPCGHHEGYHNDKGVCLLSRNCRCKGLPAECEPDFVRVPAPRGLLSGQEKTKMINHPNRKKPTGERAVLVTTVHKGVFFGYATNTDGATISLRAARNCIYWSSDVKGFIGLAATGPTNNCKIGPSANITLRDITCVAECDPKAVQAWESAPWAR